MSGPRYDLVPTIGDRRAAPPPASPGDGEWRIEPFRIGKIAFATFNAVVGAFVLYSLLYGLWGVFRVL